MSRVKAVSPYLAGSVLESIVGLLVVRTERARNAMTVSFVSEVAHHPTSLWVAVERTSYTHQLLLDNPCFTLALLHDGQAQLAWQCGTTSGRDHDKCSALALRPSDEGYLFLNGAMTNTAARIRDAIDLGTHSLLIADILFGEVDTRLQHRRNLLLADM